MSDPPREHHQHSEQPARNLEIRSVLATDCGSTTTKAILIEKVDGVYRQTFRGEAPTTVEAPFEDVTRGVLNAASEIAELSGRQLVKDDGSGILTPDQGGQGVDIYISTSSAGGGLQVVVGGVVKSMTAESAMRAALGAGAIVMDTFSTNDKRPPHEQIERTIMYPGGWALMVEAYLQGVDTLYDNIESFNR